MADVCGGVGVSSWAGGHLAGPQRPGGFGHAGVGRVGEV